jgi:alpha-1,3-glucanase-like protein
MPENSQNTRKRPLAAAAAVAIAASGLTVLGSVIAAPTALAAGGSGASVPFAEYEAESASTNGSTIGPDYTQASLPSEASGRKAVTLNGGQYVEFTLSAAANSIDVRYSVQDGRSGKLAVYVGSQKVGDLNITSKYSYVDTSWIPGAKTHKFYDETRMLLGRNVASGAKVKVQVDDSSAGPVTVDLADFEQVAGPSGAPSNSISVTSSGATPNDGSDDT